MANDYIENCSTEPVVAFKIKEVIEARKGGPLITAEVEGVAPVEVDRAFMRRYNPQPGG